MEDFLAEFCTPALLHASLDAQYTEIVPAQVPEPRSRSTRADHHPGTTGHSQTASGISFSSS
ncbi:unnamed protein product [Scytosiphon promiscuus]